MARNAYFELIRTNPNFRRIWLGDVASLLGDWFNTIALYTLVRELTGSTLALGLVFITRSLPLALASPFAGLLTDRFNRRRLMIAADLARAATVAGFLLVEEAADLPVLLTLTAVQVAISAVFIPARSASIPNITSPRELLTASTLSAATWSTLLALGAALGGFATELFGVRAVFLIDSASYLVSALFIFRTVIPQRTEKGTGPATLRSTVEGIAEGWRQLHRRPRIGRMALVKAGWVLGGGGLVYMLALLGEEIWAAAPAVGIGILYAARGLGTGIGPIVARAALPDERRWPLFIGLGLLASGAVYWIVGSIPWGYGVAMLILAAHAPSGANWVLSTVLLQKRTEDRYRGRIFATEWLIITLVDTVSILAAGLLLESGIVTLRGGILVLSTVQVATGAVWLAWAVPAERRDDWR